MSRTTDLLASLRRDADEVLALRTPILDREPWPLASAFGPNEGEWGVREVLAHLAEMVPYWMDEAARILAGPAEPAPFGREATDQVRVAIIGRERGLPASVLFDRIADEVELSERRLARMTDHDLGRQGIHPRRGPMAIGDILERFVADHLAEHAAQLRDILSRPATEG